MASGEPPKTEPVHLVQDADTGDRFLVYETERGIKAELRYEGEALWMTQAQMAGLFGVTIPTINVHLRNVYAEGELNEDPTIRNFLIVQIEGARNVTREIKHYNLDAVISVGYRVSSKQGTLFRKWATEKLVQFATTGFVIDIEHLKNPAPTTGLPSCGKSFATFARTRRTFIANSGQYAPCARIMTATPTPAGIFINTLKLNLCGPSHRIRLPKLSRKEPTRTLQTWDCRPSRRIESENRTRR